MFFEPDDPITTPLEFLAELEKFAQRKEMDLEFIKLSMYPKVRLDGKVYDCMLEMPKVINHPLSIFFAYRFSFGFRWVYLYEEQENERDKLG